MASLRFSSNPWRGPGMGPNISNERIRGPHPTTNSKLRATAPLAFGATAKERQERLGLGPSYTPGGGPTDASVFSVEPGPLAGPVLPPRSQLPRAVALQSQSSAPAWVGEEGWAGNPRRPGPRMQIPGFDHCRRGRYGVADARVESTLHSSLQLHA